MKTIKMIGLAALTALTALTAMAFAGVGSAMAESAALCKVDESPCSAANLITSAHEASVGKAKLLSSVGTTECNVLFASSETVEATEVGAPLVISGSFTYTNCELGGSSCTATEESGPSQIKVFKTGHETAEVTGEGLVHVVCSGFIDCSYNGTGLKGTGKGPLLSTQKNGEVTLSEQSTTKEAGGFLCAKTAKLDITTTPLAAAYGSSAATYCVEYNHTHGFYSDNKCSNKLEGRTGQFMLVQTGSGRTTGETLCVLAANVPTNKGLYTNSNCTNDDKNNSSRYESGKILP